MSAFMVENSTIDAIVAHLERQTYHDLDTQSDFLYALNQGGYDPHEGGSFERLAEDLYALNARAVRERYGARAGDMIPAATYRLAAVAAPSAHAAIKMMQCLRYQCSEGDVPETKLFKLLDSLITLSMEAIIEAHPDYEAAPWGGGLSRKPETRTRRRVSHCRLRRNL